jgi:hypothetical protein
MGQDHTLNEDIVRTTHPKLPVPPPEDIVQGIFASALAHLEEANRTIGRLEEERDQAIARVRELESGVPATRAQERSKPAGGEWVVAIGSVALLVVLPLVLAVVLTQAGVPILSLSSGNRVGFKDIVEVLIVGLVATILVQAWTSHLRPPK